MELPYKSKEISDKCYYLLQEFIKDNKTGLDLGIHFERIKILEKRKSTEICSGIQINQMLRNNFQQASNNKKLLLTICAFGSKTE